MANRWNYKVVYEGPKDGIYSRCCDAIQNDTYGCYIMLRSHGKWYGIKASTITMIWSGDKELIYCFDRRKDSRKVNAYVDIATALHKYETKRMTH